MFVPRGLVLLVRPVPATVFAPVPATTLPVPATLSVVSAVFLVPVNLSMTNLVPAPRAAPANALVKVLPREEPVEPVVFAPVVLVVPEPVDVSVFAPVVPVAVLPVEVKVLPVVPAVLEVKPGSLEVVPATFPTVAPVPVTLPATAFSAAVEPFRADVTAVLG